MTTLTMRKFPRAVTATACSLASGNGTTPTTTVRSNLLTLQLCEMYGAEYGYSRAFFQNDLFKSGKFIPSLNPILPSSFYQNKILQFTRITTKGARQILLFNRLYLSPSLQCHKSSACVSLSLAFSPISLGPETATFFVQVIFIQAKRRMRRLHDSSSKMPFGSWDILDAERRTPGNQGT